MIRGDEKDSSTSTRYSYYFVVLVLLVRSMNSTVLVLLLDCKVELPVLRSLCNLLSALVEMFA